jgi:hypothetical protein
MEEKETPNNLQKRAFYKKKVSRIDLITAHILSSTIFFVAAFGHSFWTDVKSA